MQAIVQRIGDVRDIYIQSLPAYGFAMVSFSDSTSVGRLQKDDKIEVRCPPAG